MSMTRVDQDIFMTIFSFGGNKLNGLTSAQIISGAHTSMSSWRRAVRENSIPGLTECAGNKRPPEFFIDPSKVGNDLLGGKTVHIIDSTEWASASQALRELVEKNKDTSIALLMSELAKGIENKDLQTQALAAQVIAMQALTEMSETK